jgi:hypothetical protein
LIAAQRLWRFSSKHWLWEFETACDQWDPVIVLLPRECRRDRARSVHSLCHKAAVPQASSTSKMMIVDVSCRFSISRPDTWNHLSRTKARHLLFTTKQTPKIARDTTTHLSCVLYIPLICLGSLPTHPKLYHAYSLGSSECGRLFWTDRSARSFMPGGRLEDRTFLQVSAEWVFVGWRVFSLLLLLLLCLPGCMISLYKL